MLSRLTRMTILATAASVLLTGPLAVAKETSAADKAACAELANSLMPAPDWYAERCLNGNAVTDYSQYTVAEGFVPGDLAFYKGNFGPLELRTAPLTTYNFTTIGPNAAPLFALAFNLNTTTLYAVDNTSRQLGTMNQTTGAFTAIGAINPDPGAAFTVLGMAFDPTSTNVYLSLSNGTTGNLYRIDVTNAALTLVGPMTGAPLAIDLAFDNAGQLYSMDIAADNFLRIDKATGAATIVGPTGIGANFAQGMMHDASDDNIYGCAFVNAPAQQGMLVRYNKTTGAATTLAGPTPDEYECSVKVPSCAQPAAPTNAVATATAPNTITVTWTAVPGATGYNVYRAAGACPQTNYTLVGNSATTTFVNTGLSGGSTFAYVVRAIVAGCESVNSNCTNATATGGCTTPPTFAGLTSATSAGTTACAVNLAWTAATPTCTGTTVKYNVYRSTTPGTAPSAATLIQSCVTTTTYTDTTPASGTQYFYIVRAEDSQANGTGPCNSGNADTNVVERSAAAGGPSATATDDVESGGARWRTDGGVGANLWTIVTTQANSPTHSWFVSDPASVSDQYLTTVAPGNIPAAFVLSFFQRYDTESTFDGHVLEYSLDGTTWSDILAAQGPVPANLNRFLQNGYNATISSNFQSPIAGRRAWSNQALTFQEVRVDMADFSGQNVYLRVRFASDNSVSDIGVWIDDVTYRFPGACSTVPTQLAAPSALAVDTAGNGVYQPGETVIVAPTWRNVGSGAITLTGALTNHTGPAGAVYSIPDGAAAYGTIAVGGTGTCSTGGNCYSVANVMTTRPSTHWDSTALETVTPSGATKTWTLHIGDSFGDVPASNPFYRFIETLLHKSVTGGCTASTYCPTNPTTREQMAVFVLIAKEGAGYTPVACGATPLFTDVPASSPFCRFIEELSRRGVVGGCGTGLYCPTDPTTREQMSVFVLRTLDPALNPPACVAGAEVFTDVPASSPFCRWVEELVRRAVVTGCGTGIYCPTNPVSREQMGVFLSVTFSLTLYGL